MSERQSPDPTAAIDQLQAEVAELRRKIMLVMLAALAASAVAYTFVLIRGEA